MVFCTSGQALIKAGKEVNENFYSGLNIITQIPCGEVISGLILQAESLINSMARYNFSDNYTSLNADTRYLLQEIASNLAAIYMIQYDISSWGSRIRAEDQINVLRDAALRGLSVLREKKVQDFINNA